MTGTNHKYTLSKAIKPKVNRDGKKLRTVLDHGWNRDGDYVRCCETLHFTNDAAAVKYAKAQGWARH